MFIAVRVSIATAPKEPNVHGAPNGARCCFYLRAINMLLLQSKGTGNESNVSTWCSSEICIIDYFLIAPNSMMMLYFRWSQINVPRDRPLGKVFPPSMLQQKVCSEYEKRRF